MDYFEYKKQKELEIEANKHGVSSNIEERIKHLENKIETIDQILANLKKNPNAYNHGASANGKQQEISRFDRDD